MHLDEMLLGGDDSFLDVFELFHSDKNMLVRPASAFADFKL